MPFLMPTCNSQEKPGVFPETPSHQIIEFLKHSTKCLYSLLYIHQQGPVYFCRAAHTGPIVRAPLAALALPVVTTGTQRLTCEERLFETQDICTLLKCVIYSLNHQNQGKTRHFKYCRPEFYGVLFMTRNSNQSMKQKFLYQVRCI